MSDSAGRHGFHRPTAMCSRDWSVLVFGPSRMRIPATTPDLTDELSSHNDKADRHNEH